MTKYCATCGVGFDTAEQDVAVCPYDGTPVGDAPNADDAQGATGVAPLHKSTSPAPAIMIAAAAVLTLGGMAAALGVFSANKSSGRYESPAFKKPYTPPFPPAPPAPPNMARGDSIGAGSGVGTGSGIPIISGGIMNGKAVSLPKPVYPAIARIAKAAGAVSVQVLLNEDGTVATARAVNGHPLLQAAAVQAAQQARFSPTTLSGKPVKVSGMIVYNFVLE